MGMLCKLCIIENFIIKYFNALLGPGDSNACAAIRRENAIAVNEEVLQENGMNLQFFVDCSQPGDTIIFDTEAVEPKNTTVVRHPVVFDVSNPNTSRVVLKCPSAGTIFDVQ